MCHTQWRDLLKRKSRKRSRSHYAPCGEPQPSQWRFTHVAPWHFSGLAPWSALGRNAEFTEDRDWLDCPFPGRTPGVIGSGGRLPSGFEDRHLTGQCCRVRPTHVLPALQRPANVKVWVLSRPVSG